MIREFSPASGRPLPLPDAERRRLENILERDRQVRAGDPQAIHEAEKLARRAERERQEKRRSELLEHLDQAVALAFEVYGHWRCRSVFAAAYQIRIDLQSLAGPEKWTTARIEDAINSAVKKRRR
jgi:hypothetical protein